MIEHATAHLRVVEKMSGGRVGVVFDANDRLHYLVAPKFSLQEISSNPQALTPFQRRTQAPSA